MSIFSTLRCNAFHRKHWTWYGHGDWRIQQCGKCGDKWPVPFNEARGQRVDVP